MRGIAERAGLAVLVADAADEFSAWFQDIGPVLDPEPGSTGTEPPVLEPDQLACVMFTSGSTGEPKGVAITRGDLVRLAADRWWAEGAAQRVLLHSPHAFDALTLELWVPLLTGGEVVTAPPGTTDLGVLAETIAAHRITGLWLTAGLFGALAAENPGCLDGVREVWTGGDVVSPEAARRVRQLSLIHI